MKKIWFVFIFISICGFVYSQQLTRFAVVDLPRVYQEFLRDSRAVRDFEERSNRVQAEIDRRNNQLNDLRARHSEAVLRDDQTEANRLETQIYRLSEAIKDYFQTQTTILEDQRKRLMQSGSFLAQVYDEIRIIAESEGYSMVIDLKSNNGIIWHSTSVDITDKVIQNLQAKSGRN